MNVFRLAALIAAPAALLLSGCAGGSSGIVGGGGGVPGQQANVRFVNGLSGTTATSYDVYFQSTGSTPPATPLISALQYGEASDFKTLPTVAGNVIVQTAGGGAPSTGAGQVTSCPVPQFANNTNYSIVIATANTVPNCIVFADGNYTGANQFRFHDASPHANTISATVAYGIATAPATPGTSTFAVLGSTQIGPAAVGNGSPVTFPVITPVTAGTSTNVSFAVGPSTAGTTETASITLDASALTLPGSFTQPNAGNNNFTLPTGYAGASIYVIDCGTAPVPAGSHCVGGVSLIGVFDSH